MKKLLTGLLLAGVFFSGTVYAKKVTVCTGYKVSAKEILDCNGDLNDYTSILKLYHKGWTLKTSIPGGNKFILVFEKDD